MKNKKIFIRGFLVLAIAIIGGGFFNSKIALAASTPSLGTAGTFGILSSTFTRNVGNTVITGDLGYTTLSGSGTHSISG